jgi:hypothetical protein
MILKDDHWEELYFFAKDLADRKHSFEEIEKQLSSKTEDPLVRAEIIKQLKKVHYAVQRKNGLTKIGFGAIFLVVGFLITCINFHSNQSFTIVMYSTSSIGLLFIFLGLYDIIG